MSEMVERVAKTLAESYRTGGKDWHNMAADAIFAMREPTEEMINAPDRAECHYPLFNEGGSVVTDENIQYCWQTMIDAALRP